jgi:hypothetical protein
MIGRLSRNTPALENQGTLEVESWAKASRYLQQQYPLAKISLMSTIHIHEAQWMDLAAEKKLFAIWNTCDGTTNYFAMTALIRKRSQASPHHHLNTTLRWRQAEPSCPMFSRM